MCLSAYIGTDQKQTMTTWVENETLLHLSELSEYDDLIKAKFSKEYVYHVGASTGCSCGLSWEVEYFYDPEQQESKASSQKLIDFIRTLTEKESVEFYCFWEGEQHEPILETVELDIKNIALDKLYFVVERQFVTFKQQMLD